MRHGDDDFPLSPPFSMSHFISFSVLGLARALGTLGIRGSQAFLHMVMGREYLFRHYDDENLGELQ